MQRSKPFTVFSTPCRVWAIASIRGDATRLSALHAKLADRLQPEDRLAYLGNVMGRRDAVRETIDEVLRFRIAFLARPGNCISDHAILRGRQEEMWHKLLELQFAVNPAEVLEWMAAQGVATTVAAYGGDLRDGQAAARQGAVALTRWTSSLRAGMHRAAGHQQFMSALKHAAYTADGGMIFVHAGIEPSRPLDAQGDALWWNTEAFAKLDAAYFGTRRIVRGYDPERRGLVERDFTLSLDAGAGEDGELIAACVDHEGNTVDVLRA